MSLKKIVDLCNSTKKDINSFLVQLNNVIKLLDKFNGYDTKVNSTYVFRPKSSIQGSSFIINKAPMDEILISLDVIGEEPSGKYDDSFFVLNKELLKQVRESYKENKDTQLRLVFIPEDCIKYSHTQRTINAKYAGRMFTVVADQYPSDIIIDFSNTQVSKVDTISLKSYELIEDRIIEKDDCDISFIADKMNSSVKGNLLRYKPDSDAHNYEIHRIKITHPGVFYSFIYKVFVNNEGD
jgi:hypothetical protein